MRDKIELEKRDESGTHKCTFEVSVKFQQNSTWQGQILWAEKNMKQSFRSVLEMLRLMDEALADGMSRPVGWDTEE
ncbi:MAG: hypothetical protein FWC66_01460 [Oscillospiraceae bacterium]|nr:hypothetical protein [Oscillospiraceae bacterium]